MQSIGVLLFLSSIGAIGFERQRQTAGEEFVGTIVFGSILQGFQHIQFCLGLTIPS